MDFSKLIYKKIRELIVFTALIVVALWKFDVVFGVIKAGMGIIFPFALGGAIAFVINVPMSFLEKNYLERQKRKEVRRQKSLQDRSVFFLRSYW